MSQPFPPDDSAPNPTPSEAEHCSTGEDAKRLAGRLHKEVQRRRTFAIISHPDAGKTTLTEKLLLYGGAIHLAGAVRAKANQRNTTSDWMDIERQRGISVSSSVLQFEYQGIQINLLDTPGHKDFSEDTYRTLVAADAAVMLIDAAKGVEAQTRKLFEVCRMRSIPIFTFMNKLDRPSRDPLELLDELEKVLKIKSYPMNWPIGLGDQFRGIFDRQSQEVLLFPTPSAVALSGAKGKSIPQQILQGQAQRDYLSGKKGSDGTPLAAQEGDGELDPVLSRFQAEIELLQLAGDPFSRDQVLAGELTPVFFGSAMNNFGLERFLEQFIALAPSPRPRQKQPAAAATLASSLPTEIAWVAPTSPQFSGFIFKIQANMDTLHRDRVAFMRICSGHFIRNMSVLHVRSNTEVKLSKPLQFFAQERVMIEEAWPGDVVGLLDTSGQLRIGDTLCSELKAPFSYLAVPRFAPEHFAAIVILDPMKRKQLKKGLDQLAEEGVVQVYKQWGLGDKDPFLGAVGALQFEVLQHRLKGEYGVDIKIERLGYSSLRWVQGPPEQIHYFNQREDSRVVEDRDGLPVILFKSDWGLRWAQDNHPQLTLTNHPPV